jgi:hypothetical protein
MKLYRAKTTVPDLGKSYDKMTFVDWYGADSIEQAKLMWETDRKENGLPDTATVEITESDPRK